MNDVSKEFADWLGRHSPAMILPHQYKAAASIPDRMGIGDLISVLFHGDDKSCLTALEQLKLRFADETYALEQMASHQSRWEHEDENDWG